MVAKMSEGSKTLNVMAANISGFTVCSYNIFGITSMGMYYVGLLCVSTIAIYYSIWPYNSAKTCSRAYLQA